MRIGIIECGKQRADWQEHGEFGTWFPPLLTLAGARPSYQVWNAVDGALPSDVHECDAYLITGSPASAYDDRPWQRALTAFLKGAVGQVPIVGICYGHQHLHHILGGRVTEGAEWGVGIHHYDITQSPDWLPQSVATDSDAGFDLVALHKDQVTTAAPNTVVFAKSPFCPFAVTQIGADILTFQAHPEMDPAFATKVYDFERHRIGSNLTNAAKESLSQDRNPSLAARWIMAFLNHKQNQKDAAI